MTIDLFTPWQEDGPTVEARTVGQEAVLAALDLALDRFASGEQGMPTWIAGPRGIGKSHIVTVARRRATARGLATSFVSEDATPCSSGEMLFERLLLGERYGGRRWSKVALPVGPLVVFAEGMDRQLHAVKEPGARTLRRLLDEHPVMLVATGIDVPGEVTRPDSPFYGQFDVWRLGPLSEADAERLVRDALAEEGGPTASGELRVRAILRLCGGQPRGLLALAEACRGPDPPGIAEALGQVVSRMVPHYQMRLRDLSPEGQHVVEALAMAPRGLQPSELELSNPSKVLGRLRDEAVVRRVPFGTDGREAWYTLEEPMLRHFVEFRSTTSWEETRAAVVARLIGEVLTRGEVANVWWSRPDPALLEVPGVREEVRARLVREMREATDPAIRKAIFVRALHANLVDGLSELITWGLVRRDPVWDWYDDDRNQTNPERALVAFARDAPARPREAFEALVGALSNGVTVDRWRRWFWISIGVRRVLDRTNPAGAPWRKRVPNLHRVWFLRARFLVEGRRATHPGIVREGDLVLAPTDPDLDEIAEAAHQLRSRSLWRAALSAGATLPICRSPELPAMDTDGFLAAAERSVAAFVLTWAATFPLLSDEAYADLLGLMTAAFEPWLRRDDLITPLAALGLRAPGRWRALADLPVFATAPGAELRERVDGLLAQLAERERGPLHPELAYVAERLGYGAAAE